VSAVGFGLWPAFEEEGTGISTYTLYGTVSWNEFRGKRTPQVEIIDFEKTSRAKVTPFAEKLKNM